MNVTVFSSPFVAILILGLLILLAMSGFNSMITSFSERRRDRRSPDEPGSIRHPGIFRRAILPAVICGVVLLALILIKSEHHTDAKVTGEVAAEVHQSLREAVQDLSEARRDIREAVRDVSEIIPLSIEEPESPEMTSASDGIAGPAVIAPVGPPAVPIAVSVDGTQEATGPAQVETTAAATTAATVVQEPESTAVEGSRVTVSTGELGSDSASIAATTDLPVDAEELRKRKRELAAHIAQWVQSLLSKSEQKNARASAGAAQAAESANGDVVVLQLSDQMAGQLLGSSGRELLKSFNSQLPDRIRQTYALIPLTPPVDAAVSPMSPLLANGGLETIANSLVSLVESADAKPSDPQPVESGAVAALSAAPASPDLPSWVRRPAEGQIVVETDPILPGEDSEQPEVGAINKALKEHLSVVFKSLDPALRNQSRFVTLELDRETAKACVMERFERNEMFETAPEGPQEFLKVYALVKFPESVEKAAVEKIRHSLQQDRIGGLGAIVACVWLSVFSAACGIRIGRSGSRWVRFFATPVTATLSVVLMLSAALVTAAFATGVPARTHWIPHDNAVEIHVNEIDRTDRG